MSYDADRVKIGAGTWKVLRLGNGSTEGEPYGLHLTGTDAELQGEDFLSQEEALELRDYINKHLGN